jgi:coenzyme PQQ synthesis protein D (PqqD)
MASVPVPTRAASLLVRSPATVSREIAGETIVVPICAGVGDMEAVYTFNELGGDLWKLLREQRSFSELVDWVAGHFDVTADVAKADVRSFLEELKRTGLVETIELGLRPGG